MSGPGAYCFGDEERKEVMDVLSSGHLSRYGDIDDPDFKHKVYSLEQEFAEYCGSKYAIATNSGTASLFISLLAMGISEGDEVLVPGYTYVASISSIIYARAIPVLVEVNESLTIDPTDLVKKITKNTKAIIAVHMLGNPCNMTEILKIARQYNLLIIEDACQAAGASYGDKKVGSIGAVGVFSFNRYKNINTGDGGIIVTSDESLYRRAFAIHDQGHEPNRTSKYAGQRSLVGLNFNMNELTGAVALAQIRKINWILQTLRMKKSILKAKLANLQNIKFRTINDIEGECATILTVIFNNQKMADAACERLKIKTVSHSGWHVYSNMEQIFGHKMPVDNWSQPAHYASIGALPLTDEILRRTVNISIGVVDSGLGAGFGININSTEEEIQEVAQKFIEACQFK